MGGMGSFPGSLGFSGMPGSSGAGGPGVSVFSDGTNGPQFSSQSSEATLTFDHEKDRPNKKCWTSPDGNSIISINVDYEDGDWEDPFEGEGKTGGGGFGDPDPASGVSRREHRVRQVRVVGRRMMRMRGVEERDRTSGTVRWEGWWQWWTGEQRVQLSLCRSRKCWGMAHFSASSALWRVWQLQRQWPHIG